MPSAWDEPEPSSGGRKYLKIKDGEQITLRILGPVVGGNAEPLSGYEYWIGVGKDRRPLRVPTLDDVPEDAREARNQWGKPDYHKFWSFVVYNSTANAIQIWTITQGSVRDQLRSLRKTRSWVNPLAYDLVFSRIKTPKGVEYGLVPESPTPIDSQIVKEGRAVNLSALFEPDGDPFNAASFNPKEIEDGDHGETGLPTVIGAKERGRLKAFHLPEATEKAILKAYDVDSTTAVTEEAYPEVLADFEAAALKLAKKAPIKVSRH